MPFNGAGVYNPIGSPDFPAVAATAIRAAQYNNEINDLASALTNCVTRDGQSPATADLPMGGMKHTNVAAAALRTQYARAAEVQDGTLTYLTSVAGVDTITATAPLALAAYSAGQNFRFVAAGANTDTVTLNINSLGAKAVVKHGATVLTAGDIPAGSIAEVTYDGTQFQLQAPAKGFTTAADLQSQVNTAFTSAGTAPAFTATTSPAYGALAAGQRMRVKFHAAGTTGSNTLNRDGLGAKNLKQYDSTGAKVAAVVAANQLADVEYDGTDMVILDPLPPTSPAIPVGAYNYETSVYQSSGQSIPNSTYTILNFDSEEWDDLNLHDNVTNNSRITIATAGRYEVSALVLFNSASNGAKIVDIVKNGSNVARVGSGNATNIADDGLSIVTTLSLAAGDYLQIGVQQATGGAISLGGFTRFKVRRLT